MESFPLCLVGTLATPGMHTHLSAIFPPIPSHSLDLGPVGILGGGLGTNLATLKGESQAKTCKMLE